MALCYFKGAFGKAILSQISQVIDLNETELSMQVSYSEEIILNK
jgi:hypothetical protein